MQTDVNIGRRTGIEIEPHGESPTLYISGDEFGEDSGGRIRAVLWEGSAVRLHHELQKLPAVRDDVLSAFDLAVAIVRDRRGYGSAQ